jgi:hypothetical protein
MSTPEEFPFIHFRAVREPAIAALTPLRIIADYAFISQGVTIQRSRISHRGLVGTGDSLLLPGAARCKKTEQHDYPEYDDNYFLHWFLSSRYLYQVSSYRF